MTLTLSCEIGNHPFELSDADISAYQRFGVEPLPICFPHQHQHRFSFRNDRFLHRRKCNLTGADIISMYPQDAPYKVYEREAWFSDKWDPLSYGMDFDLDRPFFEQYAELQRNVPRSALINVGSINSDYCNSCVYNKNCYLIFGGDRNEDSLYGALPMYCRNCVDCDWTTRCELCYFCTYSKECYNSQFVFNSKNCSDCAFVENCQGCNECIMCFDLINKEYHIDNTPYSREEYFSKKARLINGGYQKQQELWQKFLQRRQKRIVKYANTINCENCTGDYIFYSKNCGNCYECTESEDCRDCRVIFEAKDCFDADYIGKDSSLVFNTMSTDTVNNVMCSAPFTISSSDIAYCELAISSKNLFGCIGLRHKEYCILNKQYSREEYVSLRAKIVEHMRKTGYHDVRWDGELIEKGAEWGRYFPKHLSPFPYNESTASYFFPLTKEQALAQGYKWRDPDSAPRAQTYAVPDNICDVPNSILQETLACETSGKNFRIIPQEFAFYKQQNIPVPHKHPDTRYSDRLALNNLFTLYDRACKKCGANIKTTYAPNRTEIVYCEKCYLGTIY